MKKNALVLFLILLATSLTAQESVTISVPRTVSSVPVLALDGKTIAGKKLIVTIFDDHPIAMAELLAGRSQILMTGFSTGLNRAVSTGDICTLATPVWGVSSLVSSDPTISQLSDFQGKTILVPFAKSPLEFQLLALLKAEGLLGRVKIDYAPPAQQMALLLQKKAAGICVPEPLTTKLTTQGQGFVVFSFAQKWATVNHGDPRSPQVSFFAKKTWAAEHPAWIKAFIAETAQVVLDINNKTASLDPSISTALKLDPKLLDKALSATLFDVPDRTKTQALIETYLSITGETDKPLARDFFFQ